MVLSGVVTRVCVVSGRDRLPGGLLADVVPVLRLLLPVVPLADALHQDDSHHRPCGCESQTALAFVSLWLVAVHLPLEKAEVQWSWIITKRVL